MVCTFTHSERNGGKYMVSTFYLSRVIGRRVILENDGINGKLMDFIVDTEFARPKIIAMKVKVKNQIRVIDFTTSDIVKKKGQYTIKTKETSSIDLTNKNTLHLVKHVLDKQIVDMDGHKVVRVNDVRMARLSTGIYLVAVDVGMEGLLRRLGAAKPIKNMIKPFGKSIPSKMILWDEVETINFTNVGIKLSKSQSKLATLHPSDLADIIEDLDRNAQAAIFASLDEEKAADVLEELETEAQLNVLKSMSIEKAADVLEKMPADEVADILDELEDEKAEELLEEMEDEASYEVRELMEYPENTVGSLMSTDYIAFNENMTIEETIRELRKTKPETDTIYYLYIVDDEEELIATVSLRDIIVSEPEQKLHEIMNRNIIYVYDFDRINSLADIISKYNLLALPVVGKGMKMLGMVVIDDVIDSLIKARARRFI